MFSILSSLHLGSSDHYVITSSINFTYHYPLIFSRYAFRHYCSTNCDEIPGFPPSYNWSDYFFAQDVCASLYSLIHIALQGVDLFIPQLQTTQTWIIGVTQPNKHATNTQHFVPSAARPFWPPNRVPCKWETSIQQLHRESSAICLLQSRTLTSSAISSRTFWSPAKTVLSICVTKESKDTPTQTHLPYI